MMGEKKSKNSHVTREKKRRGYELLGLSPSHKTIHVTTKKDIMKNIYIQV
jgi:hypothetical protein